MKYLCSKNRHAQEVSAAISYAVLDLTAQKTVSEYSSETNILKQSFERLSLTRHMISIVWLNTTAVISSLAERCLHQLY